MTVTVASADPASATVSTATLTFETDNWNISQPVSVTGTDDDDFDDEDTIIALSAANGGYDAVTAQVPVTVTDNDILTACALVRILTDTQLSNVVRVTVQGVWATTPTPYESFVIIKGWVDDGGLTIASDSLISVVLRGRPTSSSQM